MALITSSLSGETADITINASALQAALAASRTRDADAGRTNVGPHHADLEVRHTQKRADAKDCSTGEQKALLISIGPTRRRLRHIPAPNTGSRSRVPMPCQVSR